MVLYRCNPNYHHKIFIMKELIKTELVKVAKAVFLLKREALEKDKLNNKNLEHDDIVWRMILGSYSTWGGSRGYKGLIVSGKFRELLFDRLLAIRNDKDRQEHIAKILKEAKVNRAKEKAPMLLKCFNQFQEIGGPLVVKNELLSKGGKMNKIEYLKQFSGIGSKYARNMMMDVYHEEFRNFIAIDSRIIGITNSWGLEFNSYQEHENFYLDVAEKAEIEGWELDRMMYKYTVIFKKD